MAAEYSPIEGIHLSDSEARRLVRAVVGEAPISSDTFASLRRAMQLETLAKMEQLPEADIK